MSGVCCPFPGFVRGPGNRTPRLSAETLASPKQSAPLGGAGRLPYPIPFGPGTSFRGDVAVRVVSDWAKPPSSPALVKGVAGDGPCSIGGHWFSSTPRASAVCLCDCTEWEIRDGWSRGVDTYLGGLLGLARHRSDTYTLNEACWSARDVWLLAAVAGSSGLLLNADSQLRAVPNRVCSAVDLGSSLD